MNAFFCHPLFTDSWFSTIVNILYLHETTAVIILACKEFYHGFLLHRSPDSSTSNERCMVIFFLRSLPEVIR